MVWAKGYRINPLITVQIMVFRRDGGAFELLHLMAMFTQSLYEPGLQIERRVTILPVADHQD